MKELTPKHWRVYDLLRANSDRFMEQREIATSLLDLFPNALTETDFHSNTGREIGQIVQDLNDSDVIQKIILSNSNGNKIATIEEYAEWSKRKRISLLRQLKRLYYKDYKAGLHGQGKLIFDEKSEARNWFESFVGGGL
jgi:tRNA U55 pseudouridine synthase TruB